MVKASWRNLSFTKKQTSLQCLNLIGILCIFRKKEVNALTHGWTAPKVMLVIWISKMQRVLIALLSCPTCQEKGR